MFSIVKPVVILLALLVPLSALKAQTPTAVLERLDSALETEAETQDRAEAWAGERQHLLNEQRELVYYDLWLDHQLGKYETYIKEREKAVALLEERAREAERIRLLLEPLLDQSLDELDSAVRNDLPFLAEERGKRLAAVRTVLDDYQVSLGEKLRRLLEALFIEAQYGSENTVAEAVITVRDSDIQGRTLRLGRLAQYFLARDHERAFRLDNGSGAWIGLGSDAAGQLSLALEMAQRQRPAGLVVLPGPDNTGGGQ